MDEGLTDTFASNIFSKTASKTVQQIFQKLFSKLPKITPVLGACLFTLFQHTVVGSAFPSNAFNAEMFLADTDTIQPMIDTLAADSITVPVDTTEDSDALKSKIKYHARDSIISDIENEVVYLYGNATVDYEDLHLQADFIKVDFNKKEIYAEGSIDSLGRLQGKPEFSQAEEKFKSTSIRYNFETKKGKIAYVVTKEGEGYLHGEVVKKTPDNNFYIRHGQYTTCEEDTPHFAITANKLKVI